MQISLRAEQLIIAGEVSSEAHYERALQHPVWPGGASGVTIGIGYDLGQRFSSEMRRDWGDLLDPVALGALSAVCHVSGDGARVRLAAARLVSIPYAMAHKVFVERSLPVYVKQTLEALPGAEKLSPDSLGALVSISYNRGSGGWVMLDARHKEMRTIMAMVTEGDLASVATMIRSMKRLWVDAKGTALPGCAGLLTRRDAEADLFDAGLAVPVA